RHARRRALDLPVAEVLLEGPAADLAESAVGLVVALDREAALAAPAVRGAGEVRRPAAHVLRAAGRARLALHVLAVLVLAAPDPRLARGPAGASPGVRR